MPKARAGRYRRGPLHARRVLAFPRGLGSNPAVNEPDDRLHAYVEALLEVGLHVNLTAARTAERAHEVLVVPSLAVRAAWPARRRAPRLAIDVGSGNGFPGVVVATVWPTCRVLLVERRGKKARAIAACLTAAGIDNAEAVACDARELRRERPEAFGGADLVTVRAVGSLAEATKLGAPLLAPGGRLVHWKRPAQLTQEAAAGDEIAASSGLRRVPDVPNGEGQGVLVIYERAAP